MRVIGLAGWSGAGKTTLLVRLLPILRGQGLRVSTVKQSHHAVDLDTPGKDSWRHREAGAAEVMVASGGRWALLHELRGEPEPPLAALVARMAPVDLVVVEGFRHGAHNRIEVFRAANGRPPLHPADAAIVAVASDTPFPGAPIPVVELDDADAIAELALRYAAPLEPASGANQTEESV